MKNFIRSLLPEPILQAYHFVLASSGAVLYGFPSRKLVVIAVTGTKGKSTLVELVAETLRASLPAGKAGGKKVASASTIRFCVGDESKLNLHKMTMPGRFFLQKFLRRAVDAGCTHAVVEMTSEGALQYRHRGVALDALVFTNLQPEHLERHGGFDAYASAKLSLAKHLESSPKRPRVIVANTDDAYGQKFLEHAVEVRAPYGLKDAEPYNTDDRNVRFVWRGVLFSVPLPGVFNLYNCLAALALGEALGLKTGDMKRALEHMPVIPGRAERIESGQPFAVVVDYAHTPDSLRALFETFKNHRILAVFGATGGGRDTWKRKEMGAVADKFCSVAILTDDDSYDEHPESIAKEIAKGFTRITPGIQTDRRKAIAEALAQARGGDAVLIAGKGTDPYLMGARGKKEPWSDAEVAKEELAKLGYN